MADKGGNCVCVFVLFVIFQIFKGLMLNPNTKAVRIQKQTLVHNLIFFAAISVYCCVFACVSKATRNAWVQGIMTAVLVGGILTQQGFYFYNVVSYFMCSSPPKSQVTEMEKATLVSLFWIQFIAEITFLLVVFITLGFFVHH